MNSATLNPIPEAFGEPVSIYTRADALADGVLRTIDPALCAENDLTVAVDITPRAWAETIEWGPRQQDAKPAALQDESGRTCDVLGNLVRMIRRRDPQCPIEYGDREVFHVYRIAPTGRSLQPHRHALVAAFGYDDHTGDPVITVMEEDED